MQLEDGTIRISAGYSLKIPGEAAYSSQDKHVGVSVEYQLGEDTDLEAALDAAVEAEAQLDTQVKLAVFASLGVEPKEVSEGVLVPDWKGVGETKAKPARKAPAKKASSGGARKKSSGGAQRSKPKANRDDIPSFEFDGMTILDVRGLKAAEIYSPKSPDFKEDARNGQAWWPETGSRDATDGYFEVLEAAEEAGLFDPSEFE